MQQQEFSESGQGAPPDKAKKQKEKDAARLAKENQARAAAQAHSAHAQVGQIPPHTHKKKKAAGECACAAPRLLACCIFVLKSLKASCTSTLRPHSTLRPRLLACCIFVLESLKASCTSTLRPHTLVAQGRIH